MSQQINLFNPVFLAQKKIFSARTMTIGAAIVVAALIALHATQRVQLAMLAHQLADADAQFKDAQQQLTAFAAEKKRSPSKVLEDEAARLEERLKAQERLLESFASGSLGNAEGFARYLTALARQSLPGVWITGFSIDGADGLKQLRGRVLQPELLPSYLRMLHREEAFRGQAFAELHMNAIADTGGSLARSTPGLSPGGPTDGRTNPRSIEFVLGPSGTRLRSTR
ncbi:MAG: hypothetical protein ACKVQT_19090 [Burkholderiales bacterium]